MVIGITDSMAMNLSKFWRMMKDREPGRAAVHLVAMSDKFGDRTTAITVD